MADREHDDDLGTGETFEEPIDEGARRASFERAANAGPDELAAVIEENIQGLASEFERRVEMVGNRILDAIAGQTPPGQQPRTFVSGAAFGAIVLALGVLLGRGGRPRA